MNVSDSILLVILILLIILLTALPVLIWRARRSAARKSTAAPPVVPPAEPASTTLTMPIAPEELSGQSGGALMQDYSALQSEYHRVDGQHGITPAPRKNGKSR